MNLPFKATGSKECLEGYWVQTDHGEVRIKAYAIVDGCRLALPALLRRLELDLEVLPPVRPEEPWDDGLFSRFLSSLSDKALSDLLSVIRDDIAGSTVGFLSAAERERLAVTSLAGELAVEAKLLPWPRFYCRIALIDYVETLVHQQLSLAKIRSSSHDRSPSSLSTPKTPGGNISL